MTFDPEPGPAPPHAVTHEQAERLRQVWVSPKGWRYWSDVNNAEVGRWYTAAAFGFFLFGGVLALLMRIQLALPENGTLASVVTTDGKSLVVSGVKRTRKVETLNARQIAEHVGKRVWLTTRDGSPVRYGVLQLF